MLRRAWPFCWLLCLGCQTIALPDDEDPQSPAGAEQRPLGFFDVGLTQHPEATRSDLSLAAEQLQQGNEAAACEHLAKYLTSHPDHDEVRQHYAELLVSLQRPDEARAQFELGMAQAQERGESTLRRRIQCHGRLMELAAAADDEYSRRLHRGIGLYLLALQRAKLGACDSELSVEGLLCRAAGELTVARGHQPGQARPCWYLYKVWSALGQSRPAARWLQRARAAAPFTVLPPAARRGLELACRATERPTLPR